LEKVFQEKTFPDSTFSSSPRASGRSRNEYCDEVLALAGSARHGGDDRYFISVVWIRMINLLRLWIVRHSVFVISFLLICIIEVLFSQAKLFLYRRYRKPYEHLLERDMSAELYLLYYKKLQQLNILRVISIVVVIVLYILYMDIGLLNVFGIAV
jgi:hypothetical protein